MKRVLVGMSGGVDSSVSAYLLKKEGYEVVGVTMSLVAKDEDQAVIDAKKVCDKLGIEHHVVNYQKDFKCKIIDYFINSYKNAETPNPCVECNRNLKFGLLWETAKTLNCDFIATGHYASITGGHLRSIDSDKDQSYFLYKIKKEVLPHIIFPLNKFHTKDEIRAIAHEQNLVAVQDKKDSQDICFIPNGDYAAFLEQNMDKLPDAGDFVLKDGTKLGKHKGLIYYTIGQRKGLGISYEHPLYVIELDKENNQVILGNEEDLYSKSIEITDVNLLEDLPVIATAKIRYKSPKYPCKIEKLDNGNLLIIFDEPVKSATPGQSLVIYLDDIVVGGGIIKNINK